MSTKISQVAGGGRLDGPPNKFYIYSTNYVILDLLKILSKIQRFPLRRCGVYAFVGEGTTTRDSYTPFKQGSSTSKNTRVTGK